MKSITKFDIQYAHRFYGFQGEAQMIKAFEDSDIHITL